MAYTFDYSKVEEGLANEPTKVKGGIKAKEGKGSYINAIGCGNRAWALCEYW